MESALLGCEEMHDIVIVGGGICGLATALALHRKGVKSIVLEKSETLRAAGAAIGVQPNGWRALEQLGVASHLRTTAFSLQGTRMTWIKEGKEQFTPNKKLGEFRCLRRSDLVETLAEALPPKTIRFGCDIVSLQMDPLTSFPYIMLSNGICIGAKILIGCDGSKSVVSSFLGTKPTRSYGISAIRGLTTYPNGHSFPIEFNRHFNGTTMVGRLTITDKLVHWFIGLQQGTDTKFPQDPAVIKQRALEATSSFHQADLQEMIEGSDLDSLSFTHLRYRAPWNLITPSFRRGTVTVAGDAMHVMGPFLGQGGSAGLEDAVVLARNLANTIKGGFDYGKVEEALDNYVKERRLRVLKLATQTYLTGILAEERPMLMKFVLIALMLLLFRNINAHVKYDCGPL